MENENQPICAKQKLDVTCFRVSGLDNLQCASRVKTALLLAPGVANVMIEFPDGLTEVTYNPRQVTMESLAQAVQAAGDGGRYHFLAEWSE